MDDTSNNWQKYFENKAYMFSCPIVDTSNNVQTSIGTATYLMPGIFLTAKHVVEAWHIRSAGTKDIDLNQVLAQEDNKLTIRIYHRLRDKKVITWKVTKALTIQNLDISVLICEHWSPETVALLEDHAFRSTSVDLHLPKIGQLVSALGYPFTKSKPHRGGYSHRINLRSTTGEVEEVYLDGVGLVKSPCFQINAKIDGGMSGGPVFNKEGGLCGIISSGIGPTKDLPLYTAFISLLWQAFVTPLDTTLWGGKALSLLKSSKKGYIELIGIEHITEANGQFIWSEVAPLCVSCSKS